MTLAQPHQTAFPDLFLELSTTGQAWWLALCWGRSSIGQPTFLSCLSAIHGPQCLAVMNAKIHFIYFRCWQFELTCWGAYSNHTKSSLCRLFIGPFPYWGIVHFPPQNEHPLFHQMNQLLQQLLVHNHVYDISRGPLYLIHGPHYILWPPTFCSLWSCSIPLTVKHNKQM